MDSADVDLSWNTPTGAVNCTLTYRTIYDTVSHTVGPFALGSITIPRQNPVGLWEEFEIVFGMSSGPPKGHKTRRGNIYGGIVLIEDVIFVQTIVEECNDLSELNDFAFIRYSEGTRELFRDNSFVSLNEYTCKTTRGVLIAKRGLDPSINYPDVDLNQLYTDPATAIAEQTSDSWDIYNFILPLKSPNGPDVWDIEKLEEYSIDPFYLRQGEQSPSITLNFSVAPNPATRRIFIKPDQAVEGLHKVEIRDMTGRLVYSRTVDWTAQPDGIAIPAANWRSGIYTVHIDTGSYTQVIKLLKH
jgi:hypothetical protein